MTYTVQTLLFAAAEEDGGGLGLLLPHPEELIGGIIAFGIVFFFMWKWAFPAIGKTLEARSQAITGQLKDAEAAKTEAQSLLEDYRGQLADAKSQANRIIEDARGTAETVRAEITAKATAEAEDIVAKARAEADNEKARALSDARQEVANLSIDLAEKVIGESLDREAQQGLVERYLADLEGMSS